MQAEQGLMAACEAVIFASGDPISPQRLCEVLGVTRDVLQKATEALKEEYAKDTHGFELVTLDGNFQFVSKLAYADVVRSALEIKRNTPLSAAAMETLAAVAYNQPVTRSFVEQVRGVDSSGVMSTLQEKGLLEEAGRLDLPGRPVAYRVTDNFLRCFGLRSLADLPPLPRNQFEQGDGEQIYMQQAIEDTETDPSSNTEQPIDDAAALEETTAE